MFYKPPHPEPSEAAARGAGSSRHCKPVDPGVPHRTLVIPQLVQPWSHDLGVADHAIYLLALAARTSRCQSSR
jgi:hypothetical protein